MILNLSFCTETPCITTIHCFECYIYADSLEFSIIDVTCEKLTHATHANLESDSKKNLTLCELT